MKKIELTYFNDMKKVLKESKILPVKDDIQKRYTFKPVSRKVEIIPEKI